MKLQSAVVTGSSRGIGRAIAERLGAEGMSVVVNYHSDKAAAEEAVARIEDLGGRAVAVRADVSDPEQVRLLFDAAEEQFGGLDILVSNAGVARFAPIAEATDADFDLIFNTNTRATFTALREAANRLHDGGRIVVVSSGSAVSRRAGSGIYAASKAAGDALAGVLAKELGPRGITVNSVLPGAVNTDALATQARKAIVDRVLADTPLGRIGEPEDIADVVAFLVSDAARWITGQTLHANGGLL